MVINGIKRSSFKENLMSDFALQATVETTNPAADGTILSYNLNELDHQDLEYEPY